MKKHFLLLVCVFGLTGCFNDLPSCDDETAQETLLSIMDTDLGYETIGIQYMQENVYNEKTQTRLCLANVATNKGIIPVQYKITWKNQDANEFWVEIINGVKADIFDIPKELENFNLN